MSHARLSPSNHRWPHCAGSVREEASYVDVAGAAAIDGTGSHLLLELCLDNAVRAETYLGLIIGENDPENPMGWLVDQERVDRVQICLDYVNRRHRELTEKYPGCDITIESESRSDPGGMFGRDDWAGTADITITVKVDQAVVFIEICDYKDGRGWVSEKDNTQLISYAGGKVRPHIASGPDLVRPFRPEKVRDGVRMSIVQPKTSTPIRYDDVTTDHLIGELEKLSLAAHATDKPDAPLTPGKHCQWCKASMKRGGHCTAATEKSLETVMSNTTDMIATDQTGLFEQMNQISNDVTVMSVEQLAQLASAKDALIAAFERVETEIEKRIDMGDKVPGYAMVPGRASRVWAKPEEEVVKALKGRRLKNDDIYPKKLISPAQVMKLNCLNDAQKKRIEKDLITEKAGALKLKRVEYQREEKDVNKMFESIEQVETSVVQSEPVVEAPAETPEPEISFF